MKKLHKLIHTITISLLEYARLLGSILSKKLKLGTMVMSKVIAIILLLAIIVGGSIYLIILLYAIGLKNLLTKIFGLDI